jgi:hypothetical protein
MEVKRSLTYFKVPRACPWVSTHLKLLTNVLSSILAQLLLLAMYER